MRVLIIGSGGQIGHELEIACRSLLASSVLEFELISSTRAQLDLTNLSVIATYLDSLSPDIIVNAAAYTAVDQAESQRDLAFLINEAAVREIAFFCRERKTYLIHISTDYVFDGRSDRPYLEADSVGPSGVYGSSKLAGERVIREVLERHIILRTSWVFGVTGGNFVKTMLRLAEERNELSIVADQFGAPTSARAIAETIAEIIRQIITGPKGDQCWGTYHYSGSPYVSWAEFAAQIFEQATFRELISAAPNVKEICSIDYPTPVVRPANSRLDCSKIKSTFGIEPDDWKRSLSLMLDEIKKDIRN